MPSMTTPVQETSFTIASGIKIRSFRRDPSKFFLEMERWMEGLKIGRIEKMTVTGDGAGYLTLVIAYHETESIISEKNLLIDCVGLLKDTADTLERLEAKLPHPKKTPAPSSPTLEEPVK